MYIELISTKKEVEIMLCDNVFCIYEANGNCLLKQIELDFGGRCKECIFPDINELILDSKKKKARQELFDDSQKKII